MSNEWHTVFSDVQACIDKQEFERAREMLNDAKAKAHADFIDPRWVLKELSVQEKRIPLKS